jgi:hypothetical protein
MNDHNTGSRPNASGLSDDLPHRTWAEHHLAFPDNARAARVIGRRFRLDPSLARLIAELFFGEVGDGR